jgi:glycerol uptake facilitator-like aquaporin
VSQYSNNQRIGAEFIGSAFLLTTVIGSGVMGAQLAGGNVALALLGNTLATGAILVVLITMFGPISGAHFNPAVTGVFWLRGEIAPALALSYVFVQVAGGIAGVFAAHLMFDLPVLQLSQKIRSGSSQWFAEWVATFGLVLTILATLKAKPAAVPVSVGLYITSAYWFTASTSFANPAVTLARAFSDTFAGIRPEDVAPFVVAQLVGAVSAVAVSRWLLTAQSDTADNAASAAQIAPAGE